MDTFASLMFGMLIIDLLKERGISDRMQLFKYLALSGLIAACGLAFVYVALFYLGGTSEGVIANANNGGQIISAYVVALFGQPGLWILAAIVVLACLTTAVGLLSACSDFFHSLFPKIAYRHWVLLFGVLSALVANIGLSELIKLSFPVLVLCYPLAISLVMLTFLEGWFGCPKRTFRLVLLVTLVFGAIDGVRTIPKVFEGAPQWMLMQGLEYLPLFDAGLAWLLPTALAIILSLLFMRRPHDAPPGDQEG